MIYRLKELKGDTIAVPQLVFSKLGIAEEYNVRVALYVLATGITDPDTVVPMSGSFVEKGGDSCAVYSLSGTRLNSIQSWRKEEKAAQSGVISFYMDGYEGALSSETLPSLTAADISTVLSGGSLGSTLSAKETAVYRIVNQNQWYVTLVTDAKTWNPVVGQPYTLQLEGFEDLSFTAFVTSVQKESGTILAVFQINDPIGPLIYQRTGRARLTATISGLSVSSRALSEENGQLGVWLIDVGGETFVPVEVLSSDGSDALIQPLVDGALGIGQRVRVK